MNSLTWPDSRKLYLNVYNVLVVGAHAAKC